MKAEEYLKGLVTTNGCGELDKDVDVIEEVIALKAIEMARKEEREKAIEKVKMAYKNALYECENNKGTYRSPIYIFEDLMKDCDKIINE